MTIVSEQSSRTRLTPPLMANKIRLVKLLQRQLILSLPKDLKNPSLTQIFCQALLTCHVRPQFCYYRVKNQEMRNYLTDFLKVDVKLNDNICEIQVKGIFVGIFVGSGKKTARDLAVENASYLFQRNEVTVSVLNRCWQNTGCPMLAIVSNVTLKPKLPVFFESPNPCCIYPGEGEEKILKMTQKVCNKTHVHWGPPVSIKLIKDLVLLDYNNNAQSVLKDSAKFSEQGIDLLVEVATEGGYVATLFLETFPVGDYWAVEFAQARDGAIRNGLEFLMKRCPAFSIGNCQDDSKSAPIKKIANNQKLAKKQGAKLNMDNKQCIPPDNVGYKMMQSLGWREGEGLGLKKTGRLVPILPEDDWLLRDMDSRAGVGYGLQQKNTRNTVICRGEVDALVVNYLRRDTVEDLVFGAGFSDYEGSLIQQIGLKYNLKYKRVGKKYLVLSRKVDIYTIIDQLNRCKRKSLFCRGKSYRLANVYSSDAEPELKYQGIRPSIGFPDCLTEINTKLTVKIDDEELETDPQLYNTVEYVYLAKDNPHRIINKYCFQSTHRWKEGGQTESYCPLSTTKVISSNPKSVIEEMRSQLNGKEQYGAMSTLMEAQLKKTFGEKLPKDWLLNMEKIGVIKLGPKSGNWSQVFPVDNHDMNRNVSTFPAIVEGLFSLNSILQNTSEINSYMKTSLTSLNENGTGVDSNIDTKDNIKNKTNKNTFNNQSDVSYLQSCLNMLNINSVTKLEEVNLKEVLRKNYHIPRAVFLSKAKDDLIIRLLSIQDRNKLVLQDASLKAEQSRYILSQDMATYYEAENRDYHPLAKCKSGDYLAFYLGHDEGWVRAMVMTGLKKKTSLTVILVDTLMLTKLSDDLKIYQLEKQFKVLPVQAVSVKLDTFGKKWLSNAMINGNKLFRAEVVGDGETQELIFRQNGKKVAGVYMETEEK